LRVEEQEIQFWNSIKPLVVTADEQQVLDQMDPAPRAGLVIERMAPSGAVGYRVGCRRIGSEAYTVHWFPTARQRPPSLFKLNPVELPLEIPCPAEYVVVYFDASGRPFATPCFKLFLRGRVISVNWSDGDRRPPDRPILFVSKARRRRAVASLPFRAALEMTRSCRDDSDVNEDGRVDLIINRQRTKHGPDAGIDILLNQGKGRFHAEPRLIVGQNPTRAYVSDLDGDHHLDLVVVDSFQKNYVDEISVLHGAGDGTFLLPPITTLSIKQETQRLMLIDFEKDSLPEIIALSSWESKIQIFPNLGRGLSCLPTLTDQISFRPNREALAPRRGT
jgi:hypothetical protein